MHFVKVWFGADTSLKVLIVCYRTVLKNKNKEEKTLKRNLKFVQGEKVSRKFQKKC